ncbi:metallo-beta-lactamase domain-containing protein 1 [Hydra vulgaris]|uniref:Metallo-beta-lactamase domain-containing protein 1 n=1 Tax=Hydra vulgaris TaxID=6087 RepID=A0ABM4D717_HYDVU
MSNKYEVIILFDGYGYIDKNEKYHASGTSTLIKGNTNILVDTGGVWQKDHLLKRLNEENLSPNEISYVVGTHGHSDHIGNLNLFLNAIQIVGFDINSMDEYLLHDFNSGKPYIINDFVKVVPTPGHTSADVSVIVSGVTNYDDGVVAICGDLFENENDENLWENVSFDAVVQEKHRKSILEQCDYIVPGHGKIFKNLKKCFQN